MEVWKTIPRFPDYSASTHGRIRRDTANTCTKAGRILKPIASGKKGIDGRERAWKICLSRDGKIHQSYVHRMVLLTHVGPCPEGMEGCHNDGDASNNRLENLRWDTPRSNQLDREKHGTALRGEQVATAKLTDAEVREIKRSLSRFSGYGAVPALAREFDVSRSTIERIKSGERWGSVTI